jgi:hypothetical protein
MAAAELITASIVMVLMNGRPCRGRLLLGFWRMMVDVVVVNELNLLANILFMTRMQTSKTSRLGYEKLDT